MDEELKNENVVDGTVNDIENETLNETVNETVNENENTSDNFDALFQDNETDNEEESEENGIPNDLKHKRMPVVAVILISVISTLIVVLFAAYLFAFVPTPKDSLLIKLVNKYSNIVNVVNVEEKTISVGGEEISRDNPVEIKVVETDSIETAVYAKCAKSVVGIRIVQTTGQFWEKITTTISEGSGIVYSEDGYIVTNYHVISKTLNSAGKMDSSYTIQIFLDSSLLEYIEAEIIGYDSSSDLALLKIEKTGLVPLEIVNSDEIEIGQKAIAIGSPGGLEYMNSVTSGIISGVSRNVYNEGAYKYDLIQIDTAINPGNSGGALLNEKGQLVGICVIKVVSSGYENMGFAISSNSVQFVVKQLKEKGVVERTKLGVEIITTYNKNIADDYGYPVGCYINSVTSGSCAEKAGIKADDIITEIDGQSVTDFYAMRSKLLSYNPGDTVTIKVFRVSTKEYMEFSVVLDKA